MLESTRRRASSGVWVAALAAASIAVAGCSGGSSAGESSTTPTSTSSSSSQSSTSSTTTSSAAPSSQSSNATYAGAPGVPEAAKHKTDAGAIAFARFFTNELNRLGKTPRVGVLSKLSLPTCKSCAAHEETIRSVASDSQHFDGDQFVIKRGFVNPDGTVSVVVDVPRVSIVDKNNAVIETFDAGPSRARVHKLSWTSSGWRVAEIQYDPSVTS